MRLGGIGTQLQRSADVIPAPATVGCLASQPAGDGVELVDRKSNLAKRREPVLDRASLGKTRRTWRSLRRSSSASNESVEIDRAMAESQSGSSVTVARAD